GHAALDANRGDMEMPLRPAPTGLPLGELVPAPTAPEVPGPALDAPVTHGRSVGDQSGPPDPAIANTWAETASTAIDQAASCAQGPVPRVGGSIRPRETQGELTSQPAQPPNPLPAV